MMCSLSIVVVTPAVLRHETLMFSLPAPLMHVALCGHLFHSSHGAALPAMRTHGGHGAGHRHVAGLDVGHWFKESLETRRG